MTEQNYESPCRTITPYARHLPLRNFRKKCISAKKLDRLKNQGSMPCVSLRRRQRCHISCCQICRSSRLPRWQAGNSNVSVSRRQQQHQSMPFLSLKLLPRILDRSSHPGIFNFRGLPKRDLRNSCKTKSMFLESSAQFGDKKYQNLQV